MADESTAIDTGPKIATDDQVRTRPAHLAEGPSAAVASAPSPRLRAAVRLEQGGPIVDREWIIDADLADARAELWLHGCLRRGHPEVSLDQIVFRIEPITDDRPGISRGYRLVARIPSGKTVSLGFSTSSLNAAAQRSIRRLLAAGTVTSTDVVHYELEVVPPPDAGAGAESPSAVTGAGPPVGQFVVKAQLLAVERAPLAPLLARARTEGEVDELDYPVFITEGALAAAERYARRGAAANPPIETGAVLTGPLCSCPETGELFAVITSALEVRDAEEEEFSMLYSARSWRRIQAVVRAMQSRGATRAHRIIGQAHGHNFAPDMGAPPCERCHLVEKCSRTTVYVSRDDVNWSRSVFSGEPWGLCAIFGSNVREQKEHGLFGLRDGTLLSRGYFVIPEDAVPNAAAATTTGAA